MNCPEEVAECVVEIIRRGILRARGAGWSIDAQQSAVEADHIHNLPCLLINYRVELLQYYLDAEVPEFKAQADQAVTEFEPFWATLTEYLEHQHVS